MCQCTVKLPWPAEQVIARQIDNSKKHTKKNNQKSKLITCLTIMTEWKSSNNSEIFWLLNFKFLEIRFSRINRMKIETSKFWCCKCCLQLLCFDLIKLWISSTLSYIRLFKINPIQMNLLFTIMKIDVTH